MTNYVKRLLYLDQKRKLNPLFYPFLLATFVYGLGFLAFSWWSGVNTSSLFGAMESLHVFLPSLWGLLAVLAVAFVIILMLRREGHWLGEVASMLGFLVWLFAGFVYALGGYWLVLLTVTGPNVYFWGWYYMRVKWYQRMKAAHMIQDPD